MCAPVTDAGHVREILFFYALDYATESLTLTGTFCGVHRELCRPMTKHERGDLLAAIAEALIELESVDPTLFAQA